MDLRQFYESPAQQPYLIGLIGLVAGGAAAIAAVRGRGFLARWTALFAVEALIDCYLTGYGSPLDPNGAAMTVAGVAFVFLGDLRLYLLTARFTRTRWSRAALGEATAWAFAPSLLIAILKRAAPWVVPDLRHIFLVYELAALALLLVWWRAVLPRRDAAPDTRRWLSAALAFFVAQYALWAGSDVLILAGAPWAWGLRVVPNAMYYGLFVAFVWRRSPTELRA